MPEYIKLDDVKFDISGLAYIQPNDYRGIAMYFLGQIDSMPRADVRENRHGHWIKDGQYQYRCSNCGEYIHGDADATPDINKFCWNCGADMRGEKNEP